MNAQTCSEACPLCAADALEHRTRGRDFDKDGVQFHVDGLEYSVCGECGASTMNDAQTRRNKRRIVAAHKAAAGLLTGAQIGEIRKVRLGGVSQRTMAAVLGVGVNNFSRYETDAVVQSDAMNSLLVVLDAYPQAFQTLAKRRGVLVEPSVERTQAPQPSYATLSALLSSAATRYETQPVEVFKVLATSSGGTVTKRISSSYAIPDEISVAEVAL